MTVKMIPSHRVKARGLCAGATRIDPRAAAVELGRPHLLTISSPWASGLRFAHRLIDELVEAATVSAVASAASITAGKRPP